VPECENKGSSSRTLPPLDACREGSDSSSELADFSSELAVGLDESRFDESLEDESDDAPPSRLRCDVAVAFLDDAAENR